MTEAPSLIYNDAPGTIPASYRFPPGLDARLSSVSATFNGAGASGDFLACLSVYSQDGKLIGRYFPGSPVASGDSAEVTFAPFLRESAAASAGGGIEFNAGAYGPDNVGDWLIIETDQVATIPFSLPSNVDPGNTTGGGDAHNNKYGALFTRPTDSPFYVWALNVYDDQTGAGSGFAQGIEIVITTDGVNSSAKGMDIVVDASDGTPGAATGIAMDVATGGAFGCLGMLVSVVSDTGLSKGLDVGYANNTPSAATQTGIVVGGGGVTTNTTTAIDASDHNSGTGPSFGVRSTGFASGGGDAVGVSSRAKVSGGGAAYPYQGYDTAGNLVFAVDESGNIHIPVAAAVINDL